MKIIEGVIYKHNGRIYPQAAFDKAYWDMVWILKIQSRKDKIKKLFNE